MQQFRIGSPQIMATKLSPMMPKAIATWCNHKEHQVFLTQSRDSTNLIQPLPLALDVLLIHALT